jgi:hypothetical protein
MTSIANLFSNYDDFKKPNSIIDVATKFGENNVNTNLPTPSLNQGNKFKKYQEKIQHNLKKTVQKEQNINVNSREGFQGNLDILQINNNGLTAQSNDIITNNDFSFEQETIENLKQKYQSTLSEYEKLIKEIQGSTTGYFNRVSQNNPYLNKTVRFTTGHIAYVTNQGVVKYIQTRDIWNSVNAPQNWIQLDIPWDNDWYTNVGVQIPTTPPLIIGTIMKANQTLGNEGSNIFVNQLIDDPTVTYQGCFVDNLTSPLMTFVGDKPPQQISIQNGNFSQPPISTNSYNYINSNSTVPGWTFNAVLINNSSSWNYPVPYPTETQAACIQSSSQSISQTIKINNGSYTLTFFACGRPGSTYAANTINIFCVESSQFSTPETAPVLLTFTPPQSWKEYSTPINISSSGNYTVGFYGTIKNGNNSTAIQNIKLQSNSSQPFTYDQCQQFAIEGGYQYFALQDVNSTTSKGYCSLSNNEQLSKSLGISNVTINGEEVSNCKKMSDGNIGSGSGGNALYNVVKTAILSNIGKLGFIDQNSELHEYPSNNMTNSNTYSQISYGLDSPGNDIPNAAFTNATVESCKSACDSLQNCEGIVTNSAGNKCWPKTSSGFYPFGKTTKFNSDRNLYLKNKMPITPPNGVQKTTNFVDTISFNNYLNGGTLDNNYGLTPSISSQKQKLSQLQTQLNLLSTQISSLTGIYSKGSTQTETQLQTNVQGIKTYLKGIQTTNNKITNFDTNFENILKDSDIEVLQKNYNYLFWSILAAGTVLISMNIIKSK